MAQKYKVWIADDKEHFEFGNEQKKKKDFPFGESLMDLLYLDVWSDSSFLREWVTLSWNCILPRNSGIQMNS